MTTCENNEIKKTAVGDIPLGCLYINPTRFCNLSCKHCWLSPPFKSRLDGDDGELTVSEMINIVKAAKPLGLNSIKLTGGEPLLRNDLENLLRVCFKSEIRVLVETNGTLVTKEVAFMLAEYGVSHISVSLDSAKKETNDFLRGQNGAFERAVEGINNLVDVALKPQVIMSLYKDNMSDFGNFMDLMRRVKVNDIKINVISPVGRGANISSTDFVPTIEEILEFSKEVDKVSESFNGSVILDIPMAFNKLGDLNKGCGTCAIKNILGILPDGSVSICGIGFMNEDLLFGNVRENPSMLKDIWTGNPILKKIREEVPAKMEGVCGMCVFKKRCLGGCRAEVYYNTGSFTSSHWFCQEAYEKGIFPSTRIIPEELRV